MKTIFCLLIGSVLVAGCLKDDSQGLVSNDLRPGQFSLVELRNASLKRANKSDMNISAYQFNLGDLKGSKEFYFILQNSGEAPIFDVQLSTDNEAFVVSPKAIERIEGSTNTSQESNANFIPLVSLGIIHGLRLNGVGYTELLPMDSNYSKLTAMGKTIDGADTIEIASEFDFSVVARIMDIKMYLGENEIDLTNYGGSSTQLGGLGFNRNYLLDLDTNTITIENIGNVPIDVYSGENSTNATTIVPQQTVELPMYFEGPISLDGDGTITYSDRIQLGNDGNGYFVITQYPPIR